VAPWLPASVSPPLPRAVRGGGAAAMNACQVTPMPSSLISARASEMGRDVARVGRGSGVLGSALLGR